MSKKLFSRFTVLFAIAAFAAVPAVANAAEEEPHYLYNGVAKLGSVVTTSWGTLTLKGAAEITCHNAIAGTAENTTIKKATTAAVGSTIRFVSYDCESLICTEHPGTAPGAEGKKLPWPSKLERAELGGKPIIRSKSTGVDVTIGCEVPSIEHSLAGTNFIGENQPQIEHGTSATHPGFAEFGEGSGELEAEGSGGTVKGKTEGQAKVLGYKSQELINVSNNAAGGIE